MIRNMTRKGDPGFLVVQLLGVILLTLMVSALAIDFGFYYASQNQMQTAADGASLAAVTELYRNTSVDPDTRMDSARESASDLVDSNMSGMTLADSDVVFGYVDPTTRTYNSATFRTPTTDADYSQTGGYNAVWVRLRKNDSGPNAALNTIMANLFGITKMNAEAQSVALLDQTVSGIENGGLRPIYVCEAQFQSAMADGIPENNVVNIYGDHTEVDGVQTVSGCPEVGSGNWSFADFTDCDSGTVGASTVGEWFQNGYPGAVKTGECYSTKPGNFIHSIEDQLDTLISNKTIFPVPLYDSWSGNGSNGKIVVNSFVGFQITGYVSTGAQANRHIQGRFTRYVCKEGCSSGSSATGTAPGGAIVKLRLASRT